MSQNIEDIAMINSAVHRCSSALGRISDRVLQEAYGFGMTQFKILWVLKHHMDGVRQSDIATWLNQTEAAISRQMKPMMAHGLIDSAVDPQNRRSHVVRLTAGGETLAQKATATLAEYQQPIFEKLSSAQQKVLTTLLQTIFEASCGLEAIKPKV